MKMRRARVSVPVRTAWLFLAAGLILAGCDKAGSGNAGPQAWIDAPLHESIHPVAPMEIVLHGSDPGGVAMMELKINDEVLSRRPPDDTGVALATFKVDWDPQSPGQYVLVARAQNNAGAWSPMASSVVTLVSLVEMQVITPTVTPTSTATPTSTPTSTPTMSPGGLTGFSLSTHQVYFGLGTCDPTSVTFGLQATHPSGVQAVVFFHRLRDPSSGDTTDWSSGISMPGGRAGYYSLSLSGDRLAGGTVWNQAEVQYQFVLQPRSGAMTRSPVFTDVILARCGLIILPPMILVTPTFEIPVPH